MKTTKILSLILAFAMTCGTLAACAKTENKTPSEAEINTSYGDGVLDVGMCYQLTTTTCIRINSGREQQVMHIMYEQLGIFDSEGVLQPWIAKSWKTEDNGFNYDVEIYDYITDSEGNKITADDIVWNLLESRKRNLRPCFTKVKDVEKTGDYTFRVTLTDNIIGTFETIMSNVFVVSKAAFENSSNEFADNIVSTSAYKLTEYVPGSTISFEKRPDYWQKEELLPENVRPKVEKIRFHTIMEASQMGIALDTGKIDIALSMPVATATQFLEKPGFVSEEFPNNQGTTLFFSGAESRPVANDVKLRQAICYAIDTAGLLKGTYMDYGTILYDVCPSGLVGYNPEWEKEDYFGYNPEKAKQLVAESDYNGEELEFLYKANNIDNRLATMIQTYCGEAGIKVKLKGLDASAVAAIRLDGNEYDMFINRNGGVYCADHWQIRYDPKGYANGDATSRKDFVLGDMLYKTWTNDGYTQENIDAVHEYLRDNAIAYGMLAPSLFNVWNQNLEVTDKVLYENGGISVQSSTYTRY